ncbi:type I-E CRISPR-associated protein Cse2/CasB [uncultured Methylobacterium sp.]|uniref:type I-E CRISPR-associated protein Cse2/CasB n=1 Tax=uncultured Methylobacterium sp. TaxID=157278 RepID=UPI0035CC19F9
MTTQPETPEPHRPPDRSRIVAAIAASLRNVDAFGTGPLAELRRLDPAGSLCEPTLHRLLARHRVPQGWLDGAGIRDWGLVIHAMALASPGPLSAPAHDREPDGADARAAFWRDESRRAERRFGEALFEAGFSERRFVNLLDAAPDALLVALPRAVRFLVAGGGPLPALAAVGLVMSAEADGDWSDRVRQRIARGYYQAEFRAGNPQAQAISQAISQAPSGDAA